MNDPYARRKIIAGILLTIFFAISLIGELMGDRMMRFWLSIFLFFVVTLLVGVMLLVAAKAHDAAHPELNGWYQSLMQPDNPAVSCCGEADAYWCDDIHVRDGDTYCAITDDRADEPLHRIHHDIGQEFLIPNRKLKWDRGNPTGHAVIFLSSGGGVYCFVQDGGM